MSRLISGLGAPSSVYAGHNVTHEGTRKAEQPDVRNARC